jgi:hypothetical protein
MATSIAPPAVVIRIELEAAAPKVIADCSEAEVARLSGWLAQQPDLLLLVTHAIELEEEVQAA